MHSLAKLMTERIVMGLTRKSITSADRWAENYREMKEGRWSFDRYPWLREMHKSNSIFNVGQKAAQMGFTETLLNLAFYTIDILGKDVLYVLPNKHPDASDFSTGRFDPALELSTHLKDLFSNVDNMGHKRAGAANLYIRGSQSRAGLKSLPIATLLLDEVAEFHEANIPLALERISGQLEKLVWMVSTPTVPGFGISKYYDQSDKKEFNFPCPSCSRHINLKYPESLVIVGEDPLEPRVRIESYLICTQCKNKLNHTDKKYFLNKGVWIPTEINRDWNGFSISQLYSTTVTPGEFAVSALKSQTNEADEMEFHNSKLGESHETKGARVSMDDINQCIIKGPKHQNKSLSPPNNIALMGVDVGTYFHYEITYPKFKSTINSIDINNSVDLLLAEYGKVTDIEDIYKLMDSYKIISCVIDANPERRIALSFARKYPGRVHLCYFANGVNGKSIVKASDDDQQEPMVKVDRTSWLDQSLGRFKNQTIALPVDLNLEYRQQVREPVRLVKKDEKGNPIATYLTKENTDDHYAFSRTYNEIAMTFVSAAYSRSKDT